MKRTLHRIVWAFCMIQSVSLTAASFDCNQVKTANGVLEGVFEPGSGIRVFKGIPFARPPLGDLRWKPPMAPRDWEGVRKADKFGPRAMQRPMFGDMVFRSDGVSEDCLYLNVWTPAASPKDRLPVLVYFYGGGFAAGDGSEGRYDGESMARRGIVAVTVNYRLTVFGFFAHPELSKEAPYHGSGNYGLLDQNAALRWVYKNIAAFGGDPRQVTIAGESAGSISVSAQMASPLSRPYFARAIGESGSLLGTLSPVPLAEAEQSGLKFATNNGLNSLAELRALPAEKLLALTARPGTPWFSLNVDNYFFPQDPAITFSTGKQARVPLLVGWNSEESNYHAVLGSAEPTLENFRKAVERLYPRNAAEALKVYAPNGPDDVIQVATDLASDRFIAFSTWRWADLQNTKTDKQVYRYYYAHPRPATHAEQENQHSPPPGRGAVHSAEIEYALGNLPKNKVFAWTPDDYKISEVMQSYFANFIKTSNPNVRGLPEWPPMGKTGPVSFLRIDVNCRAETEQHADRYRFLETVKP